MAERRQQRTPAPAAVPPRDRVPPAMEPTIQEFLGPDPSVEPSDGYEPRNEFVPFNGQDAAPEYQEQNYRDAVEPNDAFVAPPPGPMPNVAPGQTWPNEGAIGRIPGPMGDDEVERISPHTMGQPVEVPRNEVKGPEPKEEVDAEAEDVIPHTVRRGTVNTARPIIEGDILEQMLQPYAYAMQRPAPPMPQSGPDVDTETRNFNQRDTDERRFMGPWARHRQTVVR